MGAYVYIRQDSDLYVGEGIAKLSDFDNDPAKASAAAKERAMADLASSVQVRVHSETTENLESKNGKMDEDIKSRSQSQADIVLDNVKTMEFKGMPDQGSVTVLASLSKEDYRRQLAGKGVKVYLPELGLRIGGILSFPSTDDLHGDQPHHPGGDPAGPELDFIWRSFYLGYQIQFDQYGAPGQMPKSYTISAINLGYDWTPWAWRVQPFVPLQIQYAYWDMDPSFAQTFEASAGLGLRLWANDSVAFQIQGTWNQGLWGGGIYQSGGNLLAVNGHDAQVAMTGPEWAAGITWSGF
jgi:hypothetical protein